MGIVFKQWNVITCDLCGHIVVDEKLPLDWWSAGYLAGGVGCALSETKVPVTRLIICPDCSTNLQEKMQQLIANRMELKDVAE